MATTTKRTWTREETITLIEIYETFPELWQISSTQYKNREKKDSSLRIIANSFDTTSEEVNRKIHNLRCQFNSETRKLKKKASGQGTDEGYAVSKWEFYNSLKFLLGTSCDLQNKTMENMTPETAHTTADEIEFVNTSTHTQDSVTRKRRQPHSQIDDNVLNQAVNLVMKSDDHQIFGDYIAMELRNMSVDYANKLKIKIKKAILEVSEEYESSRNQQAGMIIRGGMYPAGD